MQPTIVHYRNRSGCIETYIAPAFLTRCEIRWLLPNCEIISLFCYLPTRLTARSRLIEDGHEEREAAQRRNITQKSADGSWW